jgi:predicted RNase H-like nuclease (RuvC/YqgF family)
LIEYEESIKKLYAEFERLQNILNQLKKERDNLIDKVNYSLYRIKYLVRKLTDSMEKTKILRNRLETFD